MAGLSKIEEYLIDLGVSFEEPEPGTWLVDDPEKGFPKIFVSYVDPVVMIRAQVMQLPPGGREALYEKLLTLNSDGLLHGAYAIQAGAVVLVDTLEYSGMDKNEFEAALEAIGFALTEHGPALARFKGN